MQCRVVASKNVWMLSMPFLDSILHFDQLLNAMALQHGNAIYPILFAIVICETALLFLFFLPGDPLIFVSGALAATGEINYWVVVALLICAATIGSSVNYWIGNALGSNLMLQQHKWLNRQALEKTHAFYEKHGAAAFLVSLFIPVYRTFAPFIAGFTGMTYRKFQLYSLIGAALWIISLTTFGYFFGNIPLIRTHLNFIVLCGVAVGVSIPICNWLYTFSKSGR